MEFAGGAAGARARRAICIWCKVCLFLHLREVRSPDRTSDSGYLSYLLSNTCCPWVESALPQPEANPVQPAAKSQMRRHFACFVALISVANQQEHPTGTSVINSMTCGSDNLRSRSSRESTRLTWSKQWSRLASQSLDSESATCGLAVRCLKLERANPCRKGPRKQKLPKKLGHR